MEIFNKSEYLILIRKIRNTYNRLAPYYDYFYPTITKNNQFIIELTEILQQHNVKHIIEVGCGTGRFTIPLAETGLFERVVGVDLSPKMLKIAKSKSKHLKISWIISEWSDLSKILPSEQFDAVLFMGNPLAHIPSQNYVTILNNISRLIEKRKGIIIFNKRNWDAELGKQKYNIKYFNSTIFCETNNKNIKPKISLLNSQLRGKKEISAYFTYHKYSSTKRIQILHYLEVKSTLLIKELNFSFESYFIDNEQFTSAINSSNIISLNKINLHSVDNYSLEEFYLLR